MHKRLLDLPLDPHQSLFLWGPRQSGKTTLLRQIYPQAHHIDLLQTDIMIRFAQRPATFREEILKLPPDKLVVIDEIQKVPMLLDEVHYLIEKRQQKFILCGSSARKLKKGAANLLGGRALRYELLGLIYQELKQNFNLERILNTGPLPSHYDNPKPNLAIHGYLNNYLREEILEEGLVRNLPVFSDFLRVAAICDTEIIKFSSIASECEVSATTVRDHYSILVDTLLGSFLPAYRPRQKRRIIHAPKFYFHDVGLVNHLTRRFPIRKKSEMFGKAFENWLFHELYVYSLYSEKFFPISYWRLASGGEVDFILGDAQVAIEAKGKEKIISKDLKGLRQFKNENPTIKNLIVVSCEERSRKTEDNILILAYQEFLDNLWQGAYI